MGTLSANRQTTHDNPPESEGASGLSVQQQLEAIARDRGLTTPQVTRTSGLVALEDISPHVFATLTAVFDCLIAADAEAGQASAPPGRHSSPEMNDDD